MSSMALGTLTLLISLGITPFHASAQTPDPLWDELQALLNTRVTSASNTAEKLSEAPATVIVIRREDLNRRGYTELSQILDDLPGMQVSRPSGDQTVKNYWRGFRSVLSDPYLLMVDGLVFNNPYFNNVDIPITTVPLSNIERIEVVYGPASAVYGANAFMGVVNVITQKDKPQDGSYANATLVAGSNLARIADTSYFFKAGSLRFSATARVERSLVDDTFTNNYEYSKDSYYNDRRRWGGFVDNPATGGRGFYSENRKAALDLRAYLGDTEVGFQYLNLKTGYGSEYAADWSGSGQWNRSDLGLHLRHTRAFSEKLTGTTTVRYRENKILPDSFYVDAGGWAGPSGNQWGAAFSYWQLRNATWSLMQDFDLKATEKLSFNFGLKDEQRDLQTGYDNPYGPYWTSGDWAQGTYPYPAPPAEVNRGQGRVQAEDRGIYAQAKYRLDGQNILVVGGRWDTNSRYGSSKTLRLGYVGNFNAWTIKALYGEGYQEPTQRSLMDNPLLKPERTNTIELSATYAGRGYSILASAWKVKNEDTVSAGYKAKALNLGTRDLTGLDLHGQMLFHPGGAAKVKLWAYASHLFRLDGDNGIGTPEGLTADKKVGDLSKDQVWLGCTVDFSAPLSITALGRHVGSRQTVVSNPVGSIPAHATMDLVLTSKDCFGFVTGMDLTFRVANLFNKDYVHPGIGAADSGNLPGTWDANGIWQRPAGSGGGYYNSLLPQAGRTLQGSLRFTF